MLWKMEMRVCDQQFQGSFVHSALEEMKYVRKDNNDQYFRVHVGPRLEQQQEQRFFVKFFFADSVYSRGWSERGIANSPDVLWVEVGSEDSIKYDLQHDKEPLDFSLDFSLSSSRPSKPAEERSTMSITRARNKDPASAAGNKGTGTTAASKPMDNSSTNGSSLEEDANQKSVRSSQHSKIRTAKPSKRISALFRFSASLIFFPCFYYPLLICLGAHTLWFAYDCRLFAIKKYGTVIHEFDPWFNYRATEVLESNIQDSYKELVKDNLDEKAKVRHVGGSCRWTVSADVMEQDVIVCREFA